MIKTNVFFDFTDFQVRLHERAGLEGDPPYDEPKRGHCPACHCFQRSDRDAGESIDRRYGTVVQEESSDEEGATRLVWVVP